MGHDRYLARLSVLVALGREEELRREILRARRAGVSLVKIKELFLQSYLFSGYPRMINAFASRAAYYAMKKYFPVRWANRTWPW